MRKSSRPAPADVVLQAVRAINERDTHRLRSLSSRHVVVYPASEFLTGQATPYTGRDAFAAWVEELAKRWAGFRMTVHETRERGERVYTHAAMEVTSRRVSTPVRRERHIIWETRRGRVASVRSYGGDRGAALAAFDGARR